MPNNPWHSLAKRFFSMIKHYDMVSKDTSSSWNGYAYIQSLYFLVILIASLSWLIPRINIIVSVFILLSEVFMLISKGLVGVTYIYIFLFSYHVCVRCSETYNLFWVLHFSLCWVLSFLQHRRSMPSISDQLWRLYKALWELRCHFVGRW